MSGEMAWPFPFPVCVCGGWMGWMGGVDGVCGSVYALAGNALLSVVKVSSGISASAREYPPSQPPPHTLACTHALTPGFCPPIPLLSQFNQSNNQINQSIYQPSTNSSPEEDFSLNYKALFLLKKTYFVL